LSPAVPAQQMDQFISEIRKVQTGIHPVIYVNKKDLVTTSSQPMTDEERLGVSFRERLTNREKRYTSAIDSGKLSDKEMAYAYAERASARATLGDTSAAIQDIGSAIKLDSQNTDVLSTAGEIYFMAGDTNRSLEEYSQLLMISPTEPNAFYRRGINNIFLKQYKAAVEDFQRALAANTDPRLQAYVLIWDTIATKYGKLSIPASIAERIKESESGPWPAPLLKVLSTQTKPEQLFTEINQIKGDERLLSLCEANFFMGEIYLSEGNSEKAKLYFEQSIGTQAITYIEYMAAKVELGKMN